MKGLCNFRRGLTRVPADLQTVPAAEPKGVSLWGTRPLWCLSGLMDHDGSIGLRTIIEVSMSAKWLLLFLFQIQLLAGTAKAQQGQDEKSRPYLQVCSCADLDLLSREPLLVLSCSPQSMSPANIRKPSQRLHEISCNHDPECFWSKRLIEAKARFQAAQSRQETLQRWHFQLQGGAGHDTSYD